MPHPHRARQSRPDFIGVGRGLSCSNLQSEPPARASKTWHQGIKASGASRRVLSERLHSTRNQSSSAPRSPRAAHTDDASRRAGTRCQCCPQAGFRAAASRRGVEPEPLSGAPEASGGHPTKIVRNRVLRREPGRGSLAVVYRTCDAAGCGITEWLAGGWRQD